MTTALILNSSLLDATWHRSVAPGQPGTQLSVLERLKIGMVRHYINNQCLITVVSCFNDTHKGADKEHFVYDLQVKSVSYN